MVEYDWFDEERRLQGAKICWVETQQLYSRPAPGGGVGLTELSHAVADVVVLASSGVADVGEQCSSL